MVQTGWHKLTHVGLLYRLCLSCHHLSMRRIVRETIRIALQPYETRTFSGGALLVDTSDSSGS